MSGIAIKDSQYFKSLPMLIQESIIQSGVAFSNEDEIRQFVSGLEEAENNSF